jgi:hypothetical protein
LGESAYIFAGGAANFAPPLQFLILFPLRPAPGAEQVKLYIFLS